MARVSKREIENTGKEVSREAKDIKENINKTVTEFKKAATIHSDQVEPVLVETQTELNLIGQELGNEGIMEVEKRAQIGDRLCDKISHIEADLDRMETYEQKQTETIARGITEVDLASLKRGLGKEYEARKEAAGYLGEKESEMKCVRLESQEDLARQRQRSQAIKANLRNF